jgi:hypothetical protein
MSITQYRAYHVGKDDHFKSAFDLECADDEKAIKLAKQLADECDVELWQGTRKVDVSKSAGPIKAPCPAPSTSVANQLSGFLWIVYVAKLFSNGSKPPVRSFRKRVTFLSRYLTCAEFAPRIPQKLAGLLGRHLLHSLHL